MATNDSPGKWRRQKLTEELTEALSRQVGHLRRLCEDFDQGHEAAAELLATVVYTLCHDGGQNSRSLLRQLDVRPRLRFPNSSSERLVDNPGQAMAGPPLCAFGVRDGRLRFVAPLGDPERLPKLQFQHWWDQTVFKRSGASLSRKSLVFSIRNQDGGSHIDDYIKDKAYDRMSRVGDHESWIPDGSFSVSQMGDEYGPPQGYAHWVTMRQISWELDQALIAEGF